MDIGTLTGSIAIEDQLSNALSSAARQVQKFVDDFDGVFGAVAIGATAAVAAVGAITAAVTALGARGADVNDLTETIEEFSGSTRVASGVLEGLREGTRNTVGDFELMRSAARGLQAGVKLSTDQFQELGEAAFVMANRGLGTVEQNLDTLIQSMITGRTRSLEMKLGIIGAKDATEDYAASLGKTKAELTESEVLESKRLAVMGIVGQVTRSNVSIQDDFNDRIAQATTIVRNFIDQLASAVDNSSVVATAMDRIGTAIMSVFGGTSQAAIENTVRFIEGFADSLATATEVAVSAGRAIYDTYKAIPDVLKNFAVNAGLAATGIWAIVAASKAFIATSVWTTITTLGAQVSSLGVQLLTLEWGALSATVVTGIKVAVQSLWTVIAAHPFVAITAAISAATLALVSWKQAAADAALGAETLGAKQDVIKRAIERGAPAMVSFADALKYNDEWFRKLTGQAKPLESALGALAGEGGKSALNIKELSASVLAASERGELSTPVIMRVSNAIKSAGISAKDLPPALANIVSALSNVGRVAGTSQEEIKKWQTALDGVTESIRKHEQERLKFGEQEGVRAIQQATEQYQRRREMATNFYQEILRQATSSRDAQETQQSLLTQSAEHYAQERAQIAEAEGVRAINAAKETYDKIQAETEKHNQAMATYGSELGQLIVSSLTGGGGFMGAIQAYASTWGSRLGKMIGGAFGPLGSALGDSIGSLIGPLVGKLKDVLSKPEWKKLASDIGRDWGVTISEELAKSMEANSKRFGRAVAQLLDMDKIIEEAGGVESFGVEKAIDKLKSAFSWFEMGELSVAQLGEVIDENFGNIIPHAMGKASGLLTKGARELLDLAEASGVVSESMREFVTGQLGSALDGLGRVIVTSERAAQSVGSAIAASFGELIRQGVSLPQALAQAMPAVQALEEQLKKTGFSGGAAFDEIRGLVTLASDEIAGPMLESVAGVGQALAGLQNSGILTQEMFVGLAGQVTDTFNSLVAQGYDGNQALLLMQPTLQTLWELQQDFGFTVDDSTQALIDQAETQGLVGEQMRDINERILNVLEAIAEVLGADIPGAAEDAAAAIEANLGDLQFDVDVRYNYDTSGQPDYNALGSGWTPRGSDTIPAMIGPGERVLNPQETQDYQSGRHESDPELVALRRDMIYVMPGLIANATTVAMAKTGIGRR